jgi:uncharacterized protein (TIGR00266 family)
MSNDQMWYLAMGGEKQGPVSAVDITRGIQSGEYRPDTLCFTGGMENWTPLKDVPRFRTAFGGQDQVPPVPGAPSAATMTAHEIDFDIYGEEMQFAEVELDPGESAVAEAGVMMYMGAHIEMQTIFGDGSEQVDRGIMDKLIGAGKRLLTGESLFMTIFTNRGNGKARVAFAAPYPGKIIPMNLAELGGQLICQKDAFLCAAKGVTIGIAFQKKIGVGLFGREGFIMQKLEGDGLAFVHAGGTLVCRELAPGETLRLDTGCLVAMTPETGYDIQFVGGIKTAVFGGEGLFFATLTGPGKVWLQSLPFSRLADRIIAAAPRTGGRKKGEGSILGGLGDLLGGD